MSEISLKLEKRTAEGKQVIKLRKNDIVPSVVYGGQIEALSTQSPLVETSKAVNDAGRHTPIDIVIDGKKNLAIIKAIDIDPVNHKLRHVAFHKIKQNDVITTEVPIVLIGKGESPAERIGLVILQAIEQIEIKAKPANLPESLELSIVELKTVDDKLTVGDLTLPKGVEFADVDQDIELVIANVYEPGALQAANEAAGGDKDAEAEDVKIEDDKIEDKASEEQSKQI